MNNTAKRFLPQLALFTAAMIWGSSFFIVKNTVDVFSNNYLMAIRFTAGCLLLALLFPKKLRQLDRTCLLQGTVLASSSSPPTASRPSASWRPPPAKTPS